MFRHNTQRRREWQVDWGQIGPGQRWGSSPAWMCGMLNIQHNSKTNCLHTPFPPPWCPTLKYVSKNYSNICRFMSLCCHSCGCVYLWGLFATRRGGSTARGGQGGGAGLRGTFLTWWGHLVQAVLPGWVGLNAAGGWRVLNSKHVQFYCRIQ